MQRIVAAVVIILGGLIVASDAGAASEPVRLKIIYSSFTGAYTPLWLAVEDKLGRKYGLEFEAVYAGRARARLDELMKRQ
jgi:hypothetical protein